jgi:hypothetical protein
MGSTVCDAVAAADGLELAAAVDVVGGGGSIHGVQIASDLKALADAGCEVVVDFTIAAAARTTLPWLALPVFPTKTLRRFVKPSREATVSSLPILPLVLC